MESKERSQTSGGDDSDHPHPISAIKWNYFPFSFRMEKAMASHSSTPAWKIPWTEEPGRLQSVGSLRVGHDWATSLSLSFRNFHGWTESSELVLEDTESAFFPMAGFLLKSSIFLSTNTCLLAKNWLIWKDLDTRKDWRQEEKGMTEDEMDGRITDSMDMNLIIFRELVMNREA